MLLVPRLIAKTKVMRGLFVSLFVMTAILFGSIVVPASAHAESIVASHGSELMAVVEHADHSENDAGHKQASGEPCHVITHHHCSMALAVDGPLLPLTNAGGTARAVPLTVNSMASLSQAPPTEPPSA